MVDLQRTARSLPGMRVTSVPIYSTDNKQAGLDGSHYPNAL